MQIAKNKIRFFFYVGSVLSIIILSILFYFDISASLQTEYKNKVNQLSTGIISEKKRLLKNAVDRTIQMIDIERQRAAEESEAAGLSANQVNEKAIERIKNLLHQLRLIDGGYIWVNRIVNYDGGDKYAIREIHPNLPETEGIWLSTETTDIKGKKPYQAELDGMNKNGELYFEYYFKKLNSDEIAHKMSYAKLYKPFDWVVATGVYLDDVDELVKKETKLMQTTYKSQLAFSVYAAIAAIILSTLVLIVFERQISRLIRSYKNDINKYTDSLFEEKEKTEKALKEKETLLREIHHRVKNNIANIEGLLSLQADSNTNPEIKAALYDSVSRVQSMRILYDKLLISEGLRKISIKSYIEDLIDSIQDVFANKENIIIEKSIIDFEIHADKAVTVGVIINEHMTNIFKYAFKDCDKGLVSVSVEKNENIVTVVIQDNGIGIDERTMANKSPGFGLTIIKMLVEQLDGTYSIVNKNGTMSTIQFKV